MVKVRTIPKYGTFMHDNVLYQVTATGDKPFAKTLLRKGDGLWLHPHGYERRTTVFDEVQSRTEEQ